MKEPKWLTKAHDMAFNSETNGEVRVAELY